MNEITTSEQLDLQTAALKVPPHSIEAEQAVLGGLMLDNNAWERVLDQVVAIASTSIFMPYCTDTAQSLTQLRERVPLTLQAPPPSAAIFIPGCSTATITSSVSRSQSFNRRVDIGTFRCNPPMSATVAGSPL